MLRIYEKDLNAATLAAALHTNGLGLLTHATACTRHQVINGDWSITLTYPLDAPGAEWIRPERLICYGDDRGDQLYRISRIAPKSTRQGRVIEVEAPHVAYDLRHRYITNIETAEDANFPDGINAETALTQLLAGTGFSVGTVSVDGDTLDYLDVLQKDVMSCIKEQLLEKWGGELEFDNFTIHLRGALGQDRRYPIRDGRNIAEITVTEDYEPVVTRLHVRGYQNANFEEINDGKDYLDSDLIGSYSHVREGYADFDDEDDPEELMRLGREELTARELPEITYDIKLAQMQGSVQYAAYRRLEAYGLGDTAVLHSGVIDRDVILRCSELDTDCLTGRNTEVKLGNADVKLLSSITAGASANDRLAHVLDSKGLLRAEELAGKLDLVRVSNLTAEIARIASATIAEANIDAASIHDLSAEVARIIAADIGSMTVDWASIASLSTVIAQAVTAKIGTADIDLAHVKDLAAGAAIITRGTAGELYIARLAVTEANMVSLSVGELLVKGADGGFYAVSVDGDGNVVTSRKQVGNADVADGSIHGGNKLIEGSVTADRLNAQDIFADSAIIREMIAANIDVDTLFAREATVAAINTVDIRGNNYLHLAVDNKAAEIGATVALLEDRIAQTVSGVASVEDALAGKPDASEVVRLATQLRQDSESITALIGRAASLEDGQAGLAGSLARYALVVRVDDTGVTIGRSDSSFDVRIDNTRMSFRQTGQEIAYVSNNRLYIRSAEVTQELIIASYTFRRMEDDSLALMT